MRFSEQLGVQVSSVIRRPLAIAFTAVALTSPLGAQPIGVIGPVYPIAEPNLLETILTRLHDADASGELARLQQAAQDRVRREVESPPAVTGITRTTHARTRYFDPSIIVPAAILDAGGTVIVAPGTRVNPLDTVSLSKPLLLIDARDPTQLVRARALLDQHANRMKLILVGGSYLDLMRRWQLPVYYDQHGQLTDRLGIRQVPALVTQVGARLRIDEIR